MGFGSVLGPVRHWVSENLHACEALPGLFFIDNCQFVARGSLERLVNFMLLTGLFVAHQMESPCFLAWQNLVICLDVSTRAEQSATQSG